MIKVEHLTKYYGDMKAVDDLSFEIGEGHVYGFLGPNGAGKSTTMNIMTGCLSATAGRVLIDGFDIFEEPGKAKKLIGYLPEQPPLYIQETPEEYLRFVGEAKGLRGTALRDQITSVIAQTGIESVRGKRIQDLSKGFRQRVGIAQALLGDPEVIILDEPTVGLDPIQIIEIRDLIQELGRTHTVIFSSHILSEVQTICDRILIISHGRLVAFDEPANLEKTLTTPNEIRLIAEAEEVEIRGILSTIDHFISVTMTPVENGRTEILLKTDDSDIYDVSRAIFLAFASRGKALLELSLKKASLEEVFLELTEHAPIGDTTEAGEPDEGTFAAVSEEDTESSVAEMPADDDQTGKEEPEE